MTATDEKDEKDMEKETKRARFKDCCKKAMKFLFSHIGLLLMVVIYSVLGGLIFQHLEQLNEKTECQKARDKYFPTENSTMSKLLEISKTRSDEEFILTEYQRVLRKFRDNVLELSYDGRACDKMGEDGGPQYNWNFPGALMFAVTVTTTIGYGNIAPKTDWGRIVCIAYAVLGIPLMLLFLANIGDVMADIFRFVYSKVCCCGCCRRKEGKKEETLPPSLQGRKTPEAWKSEFSKGLPPPKDQPVELDDEEEDDDDDDQISVPLTITLIVIAGYILVGALIFGVWEKWDTLDASYYCFVTISTIGFGDMVPGSAGSEKAEDAYMMIIAAIYMILGMAILSMCFSLMQEEIVAKFKWVGEKIGLLKKEQEEDEEDEDADREEEVVVQRNQPIEKSGLKPLPPGAISKSTRATAVPVYSSSQPPQTASGNRSLTSRAASGNARVASGDTKKAASLTERRKSKDHSERL